MHGNQKNMLKIINFLLLLVLHIIIIIMNERLSQWMSRERTNEPRHKLSINILYLLLLLLLLTEEQNYDPLMQTTEQKQQNSKHLVFAHHSTTHLYHLPTHRSNHPFPQPYHLLHKNNASMKKLILFFEYLTLIHRWGPIKRPHGKALSFDSTVWMNEWLFSGFVCLFHMFHVSYMCLPSS